eukprot:590824-Prymnesium_polylepis.1
MLVCVRARDAAAARTGDQREDVEGRGAGALEEALGACERERVELRARWQARAATCERDAEPDSGPAPLALPLAPSLAGAEP